MKHRQIIYTVARFIIGGGLIVLLFWKAGTAEMFSNLKTVEPCYLLLAVVLFQSAVVTIAWRWKLLLAAHGIVVPLRKTIAYYLIGFFFNNFLPTVIGLDVVRAVYVSHSYGRRAECFASVISEKAIGLLAILFLGVFFLPPFITRDRFIAYIFLGLLALTALFVVAIFFFPKRKSLSPLARLFRFRLFASIRERAKRLYAALYYYRDRKAVVVKTLLISLLYQFILVTIFFLIGRALLVSIPYHYYLAFIPVINIGSMIPLTPNGIGIRESLCMYLFGLAGVASSISILISIIYFAVALVISLSGAVLFMVGFKKPLREETEIV